MIGIYDEPVQQKIKEAEKNEHFTEDFHDVVILVIKVKDVERRIYGIEKAAKIADEKLRDFEGFKKIITEKEELKALVKRYDKEINEALDVFKWRDVVLGWSHSSVITCDEMEKIKIALCPSYGVQIFER
jgi:hypothetical protein